MWTLKSFSPIFLCVDTLYIDSNVFLVLNYFLRLFLRSIVSGLYSMNIVMALAFETNMSFSTPLGPVVCRWCVDVDRQVNAAEMKWY